MIVRGVVRRIDTTVEVCGKRVALAVAVYPNGARAATSSLEPNVTHIRYAKRRGFPEERPRGVNLTAEESDRMGAIAVLLIANGCTKRDIMGACMVSEPTARNLEWRARFFLQDSMA